MPLTVIATMHPVVGRRDDVVAAVLRAVPAVLAEEGCLAYAPHTVGTDGVVIVESWTSGAALKAHGAGAPLAELHAALSELIAAPSDVVVARPVETAPAG